MTRTKRTFSFLLACLTVLTAAAQTKTLGECIKIGIERNLQLRTSRIDIRKGETMITQSRAMLLPKVDGTIQLIDYLKNPVQVSGGTLIAMDFPDQMTWQRVTTMQYNSQAMLQVQMPLYNQSILAAIDAAKTVKELNTLAYDKACETLTVQIAKTYYAAQACKEQRLLIDEDVKRMNELRDITQALFEQGVILEVDFTRIKINITNLETMSAQYQMVYEQQLNTLRFLLDLAASEPIDVERMEPTLRQVTAQGISSSLPDQLLLDKQRTLNEKQVRLTRAGYLPSIGILGQTGYLGYQEKFRHFFKHFDNRHFGMAAVGFQVNIPLFDARDKQLRVRQYHFDAEKIATNRELVDANIKKDYLNASLQLTQNEQIYATQSQNLEQARSVYNVAALRYREGVSSMTELLQDDMRLNGCERDIVNAHLQYNLALVDYLRLENNLDALK